MKKNIEKILIIAILIAIYFVLSSYCAIDIYNKKITIQNLPIYVGAIMFGSLSGAQIGFVGGLLYQIVKYGFTVTTIVWVLPGTVVGFVCGFLFEKEIIKNNDVIRFWISIICMQLLITFLNTIAIVVDAYVFSYLNLLTIIDAIVIRTMISILVGVLFCFMIPEIIRAIKKIH